MIILELITEPNCPNKNEIEQNIRKAMACVKKNIFFQSWSSRDKNCPPYLRGFGSPAVFVNQQEITGAYPLNGVKYCRIYPTPFGMRRTPPVETILRALFEAGNMPEE